MLGHKVKLEAEYYDPTPEKLFEVFKLVLPKITFDTVLQKEEELKKKQSRIDELENNHNNIIKRLEKRIQDLENQA